MNTFKKAPWETGSPASKLLVLLARLESNERLIAGLIDHADIMEPWVSMAARELAETRDVIAKVKDA